MAGPLEQAIGQHAAIDAVLHARTEPGRRLIILEGPRGSGTSHALGVAAAQWEQQGGASFTARGEDYAKARTLFPWLSLAAPGAREMSRSEAARGVAVAGGESIPGVGPVSAKLLDEVLNRRKVTAAREAIILSDLEQYVLYVLSTTARERRVLLCLDHLTDWDEASRQLLSLILDGRLDITYPSLRDCIIAAPEDRQLRASLQGTTIQRVVLRRPSRDELPAALAALGARTIPPAEDIDRVYEATAGRMDLLRDVVTHLKPVERFAPDWDIPSMIKRRILEAPDPEAVERALKATAIAGGSTTWNELQCMLGKDKAELAKTIEMASTLKLIDLDDLNLRLIGPLVRDHLQKTPDAREYHARLSKCLAVLRPREYAHRSLHARLAGDDEAALTCWALDVLSAGRERRPAPSSTGVETAREYATYESYLRELRTAARALDQHDTRRVLDVLGRLDDFMATSLRAERDYLRVQAYLMSHRIQDFQSAEELAERWRLLRDTDGEIWSRLMQSLLIAKIELGRLDEARALERDLATYYWARREMDPWALHALNALRRKTDPLHELPSSRSRLEAAVAFFGPATNAGPPRHAIEYYFGLTNLIGNLLSGGDFEEASRRANQLERLVREREDIAWPRVEVALADLVLVDYLNERSTALECAARMERLISQTSDVGNRFLMEATLGTLLAKSGKLDASERVLRGSVRRLGDEADSDAYHRYFLENNLAALLLVTGRKDEALATFERIGELPSRLYPVARRILTRRDELLKEILPSVGDASAESFDTLLRTRFPPQIGPEWRFYGRGFLLTDIQFWSSD